MADGDLTLSVTWTRDGQSKTEERTRPAARADQLIKAAYKDHATEEEEEAFGEPGDNPGKDAELLQRLVWRAVVNAHNRWGSREFGRSATEMEP